PLLLLGTEKTVRTIHNMLKEMTEPKDNQERVFVSRFHNPRRQIPVPLRRTHRICESENGPHRNLQRNSARTISPPSAAACDLYTVDRRAGANSLFHRHSPRCRYLVGAHNGCQSASVSQSRQGGADGVHDPGLPFLTGRR